MSWVDIVIIALVALFACAGVLRGVKKSSLALAAFSVAFVAAFFLAKIVAEALLGIESVNKFVLGSDGFSLYNWLHASIGSAEPSEFLVKNFYEPVLEIVNGFGGYTETFTVAEGQALYLAFTLFSAICGVGIYIVVRILLCIITAIIKSFFAKKKSGLNRLFGFLVGALRGALWAFALTIVFSAVGGFSFVGAIGKIETEYESSVLGKYVNEYSYAVKNSLFLPDENMYARIIDRSGFTVADGDRDPQDRLVGTRLEIYAYLYDLNYTENVYTVENGELKVRENGDALKIDASAYGDSGFDNVIRAIMAYNETAAENVKTALADADNSTLRTYVEVLNDGTSAISAQITALVSDIYNYELKIDESKNLTDAGEIESANRDLKNLYDNIIAELGTLKTSYAAMSALGALTLEYPQVYVVTAA